MMTKKFKHNFESALLATIKRFLIYQLERGAYDDRINEFVAVFCREGHKDHTKISFEVGINMLGNDTRFMPMLFEEARK